MFKFDLNFLKFSTPTLIFPNFHFSIIASMNKNTSNSRMNNSIQQQQMREEEHLNSVLEKQTALACLYESIRTDYVSLFQHLHELDDVNTSESIEKEADLVEALAVVNAGLSSRRERLTTLWCVLALYCNPTR